MTVLRESFLGVWTVFRVLAIFEAGGGGGWTVLTVLRDVFRVLGECCQF